jgi:hypothetical protein
MSQARKDLRKAARGLELVCAGTILLLVTPFLPRIGDIVQREASLGPGLLLPLIFMTVGALSSCLLDVTGKIQCLAVPQTRGISPIIFGSVACTIAGCCVTLVGNWALLARYNVSAAAGDLSTLLIVAANVLFLRYLRKMAQSVGSPELVVRSLLIRDAFVVLGLLYMVAGIVSAPGPKAPAWAGIARSILGLAIFVCFILYAVLIANLRRATLGYLNLKL